MPATAQPPAAAKNKTSWLQHAVAFGAAIHAARVGRRHGAGSDGREAQRSVRRALLARFALTHFGREAGIEAGMSLADFQARIPPRTYEQFAPWIERMKRGEADVLWPGRCAYYAVSSGTTAGRTKYLPVTPGMIAHFRQTGLDSLCLYARRSGSTAVFRGRHLFLGGSTSLAPIPEAAPFRAWAGDLSGITALNLPRWAEQHLYEPGRAIAQIGDWPEKLRAIAVRTAGRDVRLLAGIPSWILIFAETMRSIAGRATLRETWPQLECLVHGGVPIAPYTGELRAALGAGVNFHEVYPASEAFIAAQDDDAAAGLRLFTDAGVFYEFLPMERFDEARLPELGKWVVALADVEPGVDYALLLTTPAGLCRYVIGDVVRFLSTTPPRLIYVGRTRLQLSAFGEHVIEKEVTDALTTVCARHGVVIGNFHVAPKFVAAEAGVRRGRHEWWIELRSPGAAALRPEVASLALDVELQRLNDDYEAKRKGGGLDAPLVRLVPEGTFERWLRARGKWGGQNKMPRCRSDREIADDLDRMLAAGAV
jgi:hypothetical protein